MITRKEEMRRETERLLAEYNGGKKVFAPRAPKAGDGGGFTHTRQSVKENSKKRRQEGIGG